MPYKRQASHHCQLVPEAINMSQAPPSRDKIFPITSTRIKILHYLKNKSIFVNKHQPTNAKEYPYGKKKKTLVFSFNPYLLIKRPMKLLGQASPI